MADDKRKLEASLNKKIDEYDKLINKLNGLSENLERAEKSFLYFETAMEKIGEEHENIRKETERILELERQLNLENKTNEQIKEELSNLQKDILDKKEEELKISERIKKEESKRKDLRNIIKKKRDNNEDYTNEYKELKKITKEFKKHEKELKNISKSREDSEEILEKILELEKRKTDNKEKSLKLQEEENKLQEEGYIAADDWVKSQEKRFKALNRSVKEISTGFKEMGAAITKTLEPWKKANAASMQYARSMGMSRAIAQSMLTETASWAAKNNIGLLFNKSTDELIKMQQKYSEVVGRNVQLTSSQKKDMLALETIIGEDGMMDIANNLENFGLGMSDSAEFIKETMDEATKSGIAASKLTKVIRENIKMAQNYTFKNGLDGLRSMAKKAVELKTDLSVVNGFIDKTSTVEGAITTGAQLQVLGGNYAMASDPLSMMYDSLLNVEGVFDRMVNMTKGKVFYNEKTGNFDMGGMDRYIARQAAAATGIDYNKMMDVAFRNASLDKIKSQIKANSKISGDKEMVDMVANLATWENGEAVVNINGKDTKVSELSSADKEKLEAMQRNDSQNLQEMAINLRSLDDKLTGISKEINNEQASLLNGIGKFTDNLLHNNTGLLDKISKAGAWINAITGGISFIKGTQTAIVGMMRLMQRGIPNLTGKARPIHKPKNAMEGVSRYGNKMGKGKAFMKGLGRGLKTPIPYVTGAIAGGLSIVGDVMSGDYKKNKKDSWVKGGVVAAAGVLGTAIGGPIVGMIAGMVAEGAANMTLKAINKNREKHREKIAAEFQHKMPELSNLLTGDNRLEGNYGKRRLSKIAKALEDGVLEEGELNDSTIKQLRNNNDIEKIKKSGIDVRIAMAKGGVINNKHYHNTASNTSSNIMKFAYGGYLEGNSHTNGGMPILGSNISVEGGEYVINKKSTQENFPLLEKINSGEFKMTAKEPLGKILNVRKTGNRYGNENSASSTNINHSPININLSGTIKLDLGNRQVDISDDLLRNPQFISNLTNMISKEMNILNNGSFNKGIFKQKFM